MTEFQVVLSNGAIRNFEADSCSFDDESLSIYRNGIIIYQTEIYNVEEFFNLDFSEHMTTVQEPFENN